jgi:hypothetical protein
MRSISTFFGLLVVSSTMVACGQILGIEPWEEPKHEDNSSSSSSSSSGSSSAISSSSSGMVDPCANGLHDGTETGVDCGGRECKACADGNGCNTDSDCLSNHCPASRGYCISSEAETTCTAEDPMNPTCGDCVQNGTETDVDCGGVCLPCRAENNCREDADCWSGVCSNSQCALGAGKTRCFSSSDCTSGVCAVATLMSDCAFDNCCQAVDVVP